jgi:hypothetical protein
VGSFSGSIKINGKIKTNSKIKPNSKVNGNGQECPFYTYRASLRSADSRGRLSLHE